MSEELSDKNAWIYFFLLVFFGYLGVHKFYVNKTGKGILYLLTGGILTIGLIIDSIYLLFGGTIKDQNGKLLSGSASLRVFAVIYLVLVVLAIILMITARMPSASNNLVTLLP